MNGSTGCSSGLPIAELEHFDLRELLTLIRICGRLTLPVERRPGLHDHTRIVRRASEVLSCWPTNFLQSLASIAERPNARMSFARGAFGSLYSAFFKSRFLNKKQTAFLHAAFARFADQHWDRNFLRGKVLPTKRLYSNDRVSRHQFAKYLGIHQKTVDRLIAQGEISTEKVVVGNQSRILCIRSANTIAPVSAGNIMPIRAAARKIGLPVAILQVLKRDGDFPCTHFPRTKPGFHELDVEDFIDTVNRCIVRRNLDETEITLRSALQRLQQGRSWQLQFVRAILRQEIEIGGQSGDNLATLVITECDYDRYIADVLLAPCGTTLGCDAAAKFLSCQQSAVSYLIRASYLDAGVSPIGVRISTKSLEQFALSYLALSELASSHGTSSRALLRRGASLGITLLRTGNTHACSFIRKVDVPRLYPGELGQRVS